MRKRCRVWGADQRCGTKPCILLGSGPGCGACTVLGATFGRTGGGAIDTWSRGQTVSARLAWEARLLGTQPCSRITGICRAVQGCAGPPPSVSVERRQPRTGLLCLHASSRHWLPCVVHCPPRSEERPLQSLAGACREQDTGSAPCLHAANSKQVE